MTLICTYVVTPDGKVRPRTSNILGPGRQRILHKLRCRIASEMREMGVKLEAIGIDLGGRHHSTVLNMLGLLKRQRTR